MEKLSKRQSNLHSGKGPRPMEPEELKRIGRAIRDARRRAGLTIQEAGELHKPGTKDNNKFHVRQRLLQYENGLHIPSLRVLLELRTIYKCTISQLIGEEPS